MAQAKAGLLFLGSSVVEQVTVNHLVGGSNPSQGAIFKKMVYCEENRTPYGFDNKPFIFLANLLA